MSASSRVATAQSTRQSDLTLPAAQIIVTYAERSSGELQAAAASFDYTLARDWPEFGLAVVRITAPSPAELTARVDEARTRLSELANITDVSSDLPVYAAAHPAVSLPAAVGSQAAGGVADAPNDPLVAEQWSLAPMAVLEAWQISQGSEQVVIALIDSGYDVEHEDVDKASLWSNPAEAQGELLVDDDANNRVDDISGWDWIENDNSVNDPYGHGTHVGGTVGATTNNQTGIAGLGGELRIMPLRILDETGMGQLSDLLDALAYARANGARIINLSLVLRSDSPALASALVTLREEGILVIAAAGNQSGEVLWPAAYPETLAVAATDRTDQRAEFSNFGAAVDLAAPGVDIMAPFREGSYSLLNGTSMASPHVATLAGLIWSLRPDLDAAGVQEILEVSAVDVNVSRLPGDDVELGAGRIDFAQALTLAAKGLRLLPVQDEALILTAGSPGSVVLTLDVAARAARTVPQPVSGAVAHYELLRAVTSDAAPELVDAGTVTSDDRGLIEIDFAAPTVPGSYRLVTHVGTTTSIVPIEVIAARHSVALTAASTTVTAGDEPLQLNITVETPADEVPPSQITLSTILGYFAGGATELNMTLDAGRATVPYYPGEIAGVAELNASSDEARAQLAVTVVPDTAAAMALAPLPASLRVLERAVRLPLTVEVFDRFGNAVADGTALTWRVEGATLAAADEPTQRGRASAELIVPPGTSSPVRLTVSVAETPARAEAEIEVVAHHQWLPLVRR